MARLFIERCKQNKTCGAVLCVDAREAFYSAMRQFLIPITEDPAELARVIDSLGIPDSAKDELQRLLQEPPELQRPQAGLSRHFLENVVELFADTWFSVPHCTKVFKTARGDQTR